MRIFKNKWFVKFARKEGIDDDKLIQAIQEIDAGNIDADYGGGVIKQRIGRPNEGKSGGYRTIILFRQGDKAFFVYAFSKSDRANIGKADERELKKLAKNLLFATDPVLMTMLANQDIEEIRYEKKQNLPQ